MNNSDRYIVEFIADKIKCLEILHFTPAWKKWPEFEVLRNCEDFTMAKLSLESVCGHLSKLIPARGQIVLGELFPRQLS